MREISGPQAARQEEWLAARARVESYCAALHIGDKRIVGQITDRLLDAAMRRAEQEPGRAPATLAAEEFDRALTEWYGAVLGVPDDRADPFLGVRGRLALLLADVPGKWQEQFLKPAPWPEEFVRAMRDAYLRAGPEFQLSQMEPRPIDLGPIFALTKLGNIPYFRIILIWLAFAALLVMLFQITH